MPGSELLGAEELLYLEKIFQQNNSVLISVGYKNKRNGHFFTRDLEEAFAKFVSSPHCQAVSSGSAAAYLALKALGIGPGDEVITSAFGYIGVVQAILMCGARPVMINIDETLTMDVGELEAAITPRTRCILPVHMMGGACAMTSIMALAQKHKISVIEDACQALGAQFQGQWLGTIAETGFFSLGYAKLITAGEGGLVITANAHLYDQYKALHNHGRPPSRSGIAQKLESAELGFNFRMSELAAAVGLAQMQKLEWILDRTRQQNQLVNAYLKEHLPAGVRVRPFVDESGALWQEQVCMFEDIQLVEKVRGDLKKNDFITGLLPNEHYWHFCGAWEPLLKRYDLSEDFEGRSWHKTLNILNRSLSWGLLLKHSDEECLAKAEIFVNAVKRNS